MNCDMETDPLGTTNKDGKPVFLRDLWPTPAEVARRRCATAIKREQYETQLRARARRRRTSGAA